MLSGAMQALSSRDTDVSDEEAGAFSQRRMAFCSVRARRRIS